MLKQLGTYRKHLYHMLDAASLPCCCGLTVLTLVQVTADIGGTATAVAVDETGIAWGSDIKYKFGSQDAQYFNLPQYAAYRGGSTITGTMPLCQHDMHCCHGIAIVATS